MTRGPDNPRFNNALVTGGTSGIGFAIASELAQRGTPHITITGRDQVRGEAALAKIHDHVPDSHVVFLAADLTSPTARRDIADYVESNMPEGLDLLVNNAGAMGNRLTPDRQDIAIATNLVAPVGLTMVLYDSLQAASKPDQPSQVWGISSTASRRMPVTYENLAPYDFMNLPHRYFGRYALSKRASNIATLALAEELGSGVRLNNLNPGVTETEFNQRSGGVVSALLERYPRVARGVARIRSAVPPQEVAGVLLDLTERSDLFNGESFNMDGQPWQPEGVDIVDRNLRYDLLDVTKHLAGV
jgi:NAD(P)-dependent dehydrogenase (short-subunit alcohol dehydrogenase family)